MKGYCLGWLTDSQERFYLPRASFDTHWHLIGGTGKGKTTAIHTLLHEILLDPCDQSCLVIVDRLGGLSWDLLRWIASEFAPPSVPERLVYIEPAREDVVIGFNPLLFQTEGEGYYRVSQAAEIILRGWAAQNLDEMPRLARWLFNSFYACALLGLTIADSAHLLLPGSPYHRPLLALLPDRLRHEWQELIDARSAEVARMLESARNRLKPFFDCPPLRSMFGATTNRLDIPRFMREGKIVLLNLRSGNRIPEQIADAIGGLVIHEALTTARALPLGVQYPTYLFLDEFQRFVGPDMEAAIPEVRQLGVKLVLGHQSFSQLKQGDSDLTSLIFQAQSRMMFGVQGEDADLLAHELAMLHFDPYRVKDELYTRRQRISGHRVIELASTSEARQAAENWSRSFGASWTEQAAKFRGLPTTDTAGRGRSQQSAEGGSIGHTETFGRHEQLLPIYEEYLELASRTYATFDEQRNEWARDIRKLKRGQALVRLVDDDRSLRVNIKKSAPGHLDWNLAELRQECPEALDEVEQLIARNFEREWFTTPERIEAETMRRLDRVLHPRIDVAATIPPAATQMKTDDDEHPFG